MCGRRGPDYHGASRPGDRGGLGLDANARLPREVPALRRAPIVVHRA